MKYCFNGGPLDGRMISIDGLSPARMGGSGDPDARGPLGEEYYLLNQSDRNYSWTSAISDPDRRDRTRWS